MTYDSCEYVRKMYGVPARVGMQVKIGGKKGIIKRGSNYISVLMEGEKSLKNYHPTAGVTYFNEDGTVAMTTMEEE